MKKKIVFLAIILFFAGFLLMMPCDKMLSCNGPISNYIGYPLLWFLIWIPLTLLALTLKNEKHKFWLIFTGVFFSASMILVFATPEYGSGVVSIDRELVNWFLLGLYSFISIVYFIVQFIKRKKTST